MAGLGCEWLIIVVAAKDIKMGRKLLATYIPVDPQPSGVVDIYLATPPVLPQVYLSWTLGDIFWNWWTSDPEHPGKIDVQLYMTPNLRPGVDPTRRCRFIKEYRFMGEFFPIDLTADYERSFGFPNGNWTQYVFMRGVNRSSGQEWDMWEGVLNWHYA
jgi:hypothetical protein